MPLRSKGRMLSASICSLSTLLCLIVYPLSFLSAPTTLLGRPPSPRYMYMFSVHACSTREKGGKKRNQILSRQGDWQAEIWDILQHETDTATILNSDYTGENWHDPKICFLKRGKTLSYWTPIYFQRPLFIPCNSSWCPLFTKCFCQPQTDKETNRYHIMMEITNYLHLSQKSRLCTSITSKDSTFFRNFFPWDISLFCDTFLCHTFGSPSAPHQTCAPHSWFIAASFCSRKKDNTYLLSETSALYPQFLGSVV